MMKLTKRAIIYQVSDGRRQMSGDREQKKLPPASAGAEMLGAWFAPSGNHGDRTDFMLRNRTNQKLATKGNRGLAGQGWV
jgi:hypothetical protein